MSMRVQISATLFVSTMESVCSRRGMCPPEDIVWADTAEGRVRDVQVTSANVVQSHVDPQHNGIGDLNQGLCAGSTFNGSCGPILYLFISSLMMTTRATNDTVELIGRVCNLFPHDILTNFLDSSQKRLPTLCFRNKPEGPHTRILSSATAPPMVHIQGDSTCLKCETSFNCLVYS